MLWPTFLFENLCPEEETHEADVGDDVKGSNQRHRCHHGFWKDFSGSVNFTKDLHMFIVSDSN